MRRATLIRPGRRDMQIIGFYVGKVVFGLALLQLPALALAGIWGEWNAFSAIAIGVGLAVIIGRLTEVRLFTRADLDWSHGMVAVASAWLAGPLLLAVPLYLSGHYAGFVDAVFDAMSGLTTSGLALIQDLDHLPHSINILRHLTHFAGGQGIVVVVLTSVAASSADTHALLVGEGREERVVPNIVRTARFIYGVAFAYGLAGTAVLWLATTNAGLTSGRALFHSINLFMAGFDTGGFSPNSTSVAYYHSFPVELVIIVLMFAGTFSFNLHYVLWRRRVSEMWKNIETRTLAVTLLLTTLLALAGLGRAGAFTDAVPMFRKGFFTVVSAHTGTGFGVNAGRLYVTDWGLIAPAAVVVAMALGGMASSTAGGFKAIRVGLAVKSVLRDIRSHIAPKNAMIVASYHSQHRRMISDEQVRGAVTILLLFTLTYLAGAIVGVYYGFGFDEALFESTSATANVGLSAGVLGATNPLPLKLVYIVQMYLGRLEFLAAFALVGWWVAAIRGRT